MNIAVEHYVTKVIQQKLFSVMNQLPVNEFGPRVVVACPEGEYHEIGAQAATYLAAARGCHVYYLGPNLPLADLETLCERVRPDLILLSVTETKPEGGVHHLLHGLRTLSQRWPVAVGGQGPVQWSTSWRIQASSCLMISEHFTPVSRIFSQPTSARFIKSSPFRLDARPQAMVFPRLFASLRHNAPKTDEAHMGQRSSGMIATRN